MAEVADNGRPLIEKPRWVPDDEDPVPLQVSHELPLPHEQVVVGRVDNKAIGGAAHLFRRVGRGEDRRSERAFRDYAPDPLDV